jgi:DNA (cytosine-5)-methyltransferase 1
MTHGSLFSGIGGFDLAAEWMGWENKFHCEWNEFGQKVLKHYWPNAESFHDITKTDFTKYANRIDILTGGFPCQPYSMAGKRKGKEDERHLWPEMLRCIREVKPRWVVGENVLGLVNWSGGLVFHEVQADLEAEGYEVFPYVLPAAAVNAPHRRDRVWFVAHSNSFGDRRTTMQQSNPYKQGWSSETDKGIGNKGEQQFICDTSIQGITSNSNNNGLYKCHCGDEIESSQRGFNALGDINESNGNGNTTNTESIGLCSKMAIRELERGQRFEFSFERNKWDSFPSVSPLCTGNDGLSDRLDGITFSKWRKESIKAGGNAIVPQVALQIFKTIQQYESRTN